MLNYQRTMRAFKRKHPYLGLLITTLIFSFGTGLSGFIGFCPILLAAFVHWSCIFCFLISIPFAVVFGKIAIDLSIF